MLLRELLESFKGVDLESEVVISGEDGQTAKVAGVEEFTGVIVINI